MGTAAAGRMVGAAAMVVGMIAGVGLVSLQAQPSGATTTDLARQRDLANPPRCIEWWMNGKHFDLCE